MMRRLKAKVGQGGTVVVHDRVDYPVGTELEIDVHEPGTAGNDELEEDFDSGLPPDELAKREAALGEAYKRYRAGEKMCSAEELWARLEEARR